MRPSLPLATLPSRRTGSALTGADCDDYSHKIVDIWAAASDQVAQELFDGIGQDVVIDPTGNEKETASFNPIFMMADSGARGSNQQISQPAGIRGLMAKPSGEIIEIAHHGELP